MIKPYYENLLRLEQLFSAFGKPTLIFEYIFLCVLCASSERSERVRDIVLINAGAALYVCGKAENITEGIKLAAQSIDNGAALGKLNLLRDFLKVNKE